MRVRDCWRAFAEICVPSCTSVRGAINNAMGGSAVPRICCYSRPARSNIFIFVQSPEAPIVHQGPAAVLASHHPVPPLFLLESLKQASDLGPRTALLNWAWSLAGASRLPSCFKCGRLFAELGARGLETCDEYMSGAPCSSFLQVLVLPSSHNFQTVPFFKQHSLSFFRCACLAVVDILLTATLTSFTSFLVLRLLSPAASLFT
jgi:hypothetical protein